MRRALREQLPAYTAVYGLMPWHFDGGLPALTFGEIDEYADQAAELVKLRSGVS